MERNPMDNSTRCIVIGASAGGVEALKEVVSRLPSDLPVPVLVVLHIPPYVASALPHILGQAGPLPAIHPKDGAKLKPGTIYIAPPDHHLLVVDGTVGVSKGPRENRHRPSIDALFRSAAYTYGPAVIGVVLSGALDDGTSGLWSIKHRGGVTIIQEPNDARFESMPRSALEYVAIDHRLPALEIGGLLGRLATQPVPLDTHRNAQLEARLGTEFRIAKDNGAFQKGIMTLGELTPFTCPECKGALVKLVEDKMTRYRCHTGHAYSDSALLEAVMESTGEMLWQVIRSLEEGVMLLNHMGRHLEAEGDTKRAKAFLDKARELEKRSTTFHDAVLSHESLSAENLGQEPET